MAQTKPSVIHAVPLEGMEKIFKSKIFNSQRSSGMLPYRIRIPARADSLTSLPLLLLLHGSGERGEDNLAQLRHFNYLWNDESGLSAFPCVVVIPQCPSGKRWVETDWTAVSHERPVEISSSLALVMELVQSLTAELRLDTNRLYLMGLSMGGFGTWDLLSRYPRMFAAGVPICGGGDEHFAAAMKVIPLWVFHGGLDNVVLPVRSRNMVEAIRAQAGNVRYTEYPDIAHGSWYKAFKEPELLPWMLSQIKNAAKGSGE